MSNHVKRSRKAAAWMAGGTIALGGAAGATIHLTAATAAAPSGGAAVTGSTQQSATGTGTGNGSGGGNNGGGVGNGPTGSNPAVKSLSVVALKPGTQQPAGATDDIVKGIAPGVDGTLTVRVSNPNGQAVLLTSIKSAVRLVSQGSTGPVDCQPSWIGVETFASPGLSIGKNSDRDVQLKVTFQNLPDVNQDRCKGARYSVTFTATANQA